MFCYQLEEIGHLVRVLANGDVLPCCGPGNLVIGNANSQHINEILFGKKVDEYRESIAAGKPLPPCDHCRFLQRSSSSLYDAKDYGWDIPEPTRCYDENPDLEQQGFFAWLSELPDTRLRAVLTDHYRSRARKIVESPGVEDTTSAELSKVTQANRSLFPAYRSGGPVIVYGAGVDARWLYKHTILKHLPIVAFADADPSKQGGHLFDIPIIAPEEMATQSPHHVILASRRYQKEIQETVRDKLRGEVAISVPLTAE